MLIVNRVSSYPGENNFCQLFVTTNFYYSGGGSCTRPYCSGFFTLVVALFNNIYGSAASLEIFEKPLS